MKSTRMLLAGIATTGLALAAAPVLADREKEFGAKLQGLQEVPSVITGASGRFKLEIDRRSGVIEWELNYRDLQGTATQAHIHVGQQHTNGAISVFLCSNLPNPPSGTPGCGATSDRIRGTITSASVIGPIAQGVLAGELEDLLMAIKRGAAYANVHSSLFLGGEIRGQIKKDGDDD